MTRRLFSLLFLFIACSCLPFGLAAQTAPGDDPGDSPGDVPGGDIPDFQIGGDVPPPSVIGGDSVVIMYLPPVGTVGRWEASTDLENWVADSALQTATEFPLVHAVDVPAVDETVYYRFKIETQ